MLALPLAECCEVVSAFLIWAYSKVSCSDDLPLLPSTKETVEAVLFHMFLLHAVTRDIVVDCGQQLHSRLWKEFCRLFKVLMSLSFAFYLEINGQMQRYSQEMKPLHLQEGPDGLHPHQHGILQVLQLSLHLRSSVLGESEGMAVYARFASVE